MPEQNLSVRLSDIRAESQPVLKRYDALWGVFDLPGSTKRLEAIEQELAKPEAWENPQSMTPLLQEKGKLEEQVKRLTRLAECRKEFEEWLELASESEESEALESLEEELRTFRELVEESELLTFLNGPHDDCAALLEIHPGAGGTESQDWGEMLLRMYTRWAQQHGYKLEELDYQPGEEAGIKRVTLRISGPHAYGLLKSERGTHRLIRISPFDASGRRHTSFTAVDVIADVSDDIQIEIKESDLRIDIFHSSGPGGQSVNTTSSAVRITHLPTGVVVQCQNERSQLHNREGAMRVLKARLYALEEAKRDKERQQAYANKGAIDFGSQIRTYTLQPFRLVTDHRTGKKYTDVDAILDGGIDHLQHDFLVNNARANA
ncbi:MAG: peptide chain release factor 2 [Desulfovibrio sp.]|nr:peptide chain release factor 2 [Desulfovibrio sp.]